MTSQNRRLWGPTMTENDLSDATWVGDPKWPINDRVWLLDDLDSQRNSQKMTKNDAPAADAALSLVPWSAGTLDSAVV